MLKTETEKTTGHKTAQQKFDILYISSAEIIKELNVSRMTISHARKRGLLAGSISVTSGSLFLWERDKIRPVIDAWKIILDARRHPSP